MAKHKCEKEKPKTLSLLASTLIQAVYQTTENETMTTEGTEAKQHHPDSWWQFKYSLGMSQVHMDNMTKYN